MKKELKRKLPPPKRVLVKKAVEAPKKPVAVLEMKKGEGVLRSGIKPVSPEDAAKLDAVAKKDPVLRTSPEGVLLSKVIVSPEGIVLKVLD